MQLAAQRHRDLCATIEDLKSLCDTQQSDLASKASALREHERTSKECEKLIAEPPEGWDGSWTLTEK